jgi:putative DNA methylase
LLTFASSVNDLPEIMTSDKDRALAVITYLALLLDRVAMFGNSLCAWYYQEQAVSGLFSRQALPMLWDFAEVSLFADISGGVVGGLSRLVDAIDIVDFANEAVVVRGAAQRLPSQVTNCDAVITDPPYYDNIPYADLSDFFYVWMKRTLGPWYPEHFAASTTPKKSEAIAEPARHNGDKLAAKVSYESMMLASFKEAARVLKPNGVLVVVYAHKTTLGWSTLVDALKTAEFMVTEAWPVDTEGPGRLRAHDSAALASSIFLVARKRDAVSIGNYERQVRPVGADCG